MRPARFHANESHVQNNTNYPAIRCRKISLLRTLSTNEDKEAPGLGIRRLSPTEPQAHLHLFRELSLWKGCNPRTGRPGQASHPKRNMLNEVTPIAVKGSRNSNSLSAHDQGITFNDTLIYPAESVWSTSTTRLSRAHRSSSPTRRRRGWSRARWWPRAPGSQTTVRSSLWGTLHVETRLSVKIQGQGREGVAMLTICGLPVQSTKRSRSRSWTPTRRRRGWSRARSSMMASSRNRTDGWCRSGPTDYCEK